MTAQEEHRNVGPLPSAWSRDVSTGLYIVSGIMRHPPLRARVRVCEALYEPAGRLLDRLGVPGARPLGRPRAAPLGELDDGVSILSFEEACTGFPTARVDLVRRVGDYVVVVTVRAVPVGVVDELHEAMIPLLAAVHPLAADVVAARLATRHHGERRPSFEDCY